MEGDDGVRIRERSKDGKVTTWKTLGKPGDAVFAVAGPMERQLPPISDEDMAFFRGDESLESNTTKRPAQQKRRTKAQSKELNVVFADQLPDKHEPPDELVEGILTSGGGSVLYGDSNSGKTFLALDMAAAVASGSEWLGRRTEAGVVVYLAAESPGSVRGRLQAFQKHHGVRIPDFAIVQNPIDLFESEGDTQRIIDLVASIESERNKKVRLIVGDTLARMSAGANENAGQDMGLVVRRFDRIRAECQAHFMLIHHSGKSAASGARGWSGIRAAVDSELEVTDGFGGRCLEVNKQRDLSSKGQRIGFRLQSILLGLTKWGKEATSCVVVDADAPMRGPSRRANEVDGAVAEFLVSKRTGVKRSEVAAHFDKRFGRTAVYQAIRNLVLAGAVHEAAGMVSISNEVIK